MIVHRIRSFRSKNQRTSDVFWLLRGRLGVAGEVLLGWLSQVRALIGGFSIVFWPSELIAQ